MLPTESNPLWQDVRIPEFDALKRPGKFNVVVIGGGITGLSAALFLKQAGKRVCVLERNRLGQAETGHTTAHLTCVTDIRLKDLVKHFDRETAALVWYAGATALALIEQTIREYQIACEFHRTPGFLHAALDGQADETDELKAEAQLARELGFDAEFISNVPLVHKPGIRVPDQAKFHPTKYVAGLARAVQGDGCEIHEQSEASEVVAEPLAVVANDVRLPCDYVVIATHVPLMGKSGLMAASLLQTKLASYSTYVVSGRVPAGGLPDLSAWDTGDPYYYLRVDAGADGERVIFGGNDHKTGQEPDTEGCYARLQEKLLSIMPEVTVDRRWSGQVIQTNDGLPYIGISSERQFVATGFNGNGITFGTLAGMMARDAVLDRDNPWRDLFSVGRTHVRGGTWEYIKENLDFPFYLLADRLKTRKRKSQSTRTIKRGQGAVLKLDGQRVACSRDEHGRLNKVSAVCTHLGCLVRWNSAEQTWDCPCHGSRFLPNGDVIAGPAESPLEAVDKSSKKAKSDASPSAKA